MDQADSDHYTVKVTLVNHLQDIHIILMAGYVGIYCHIAPHIGLTIP